MSNHNHPPHKFFFETLGNETRWQIIHLLLKSDHRATEISDKLGYEQSLVSHHLGRLKKCGFVSSRANGKERIYLLNKTTIAPLLKLADKHIDDYCCKYCVEK